MTCEHPETTTTSTLVLALQPGNVCEHPGYGPITVETITPLLTGDTEVLFRKPDGQGYLVTFTAGAMVELIA